MQNPGDNELVEILRTTRTIAVVGASANPDKPAHSIPAYLHSQGYTVIPVNPAGGTLVGRSVVAPLGEVEEPIDVVEVFRPPREAPDIARQAIAAGAAVLWLQAGIVSEEAARIASEAGLTVVMDMCMGATHRRLAGRLTGDGDPVG